MKLFFRRKATKKLMQCAYNEMIEFGAYLTDQETHVIESIYEEWVDKLIYYGSVDIRKT